MKREGFTWRREREREGEEGREWRIGRSRSSKVIDFVTNRKDVCDFLLVIIVTLVLSCTVSESCELFYPTLILTSSLGVYPFEFLDKLFYRQD